LPTFALWAWKSFIGQFFTFTIPAKVPAVASAAKSAVPAPVSPSLANPSAAAAKPPDAPSRKPEPAAVPAPPKAPAEQAQARTASKADLERVQKLIQFMEEQVRWDWAEVKRTYGTSAGIKKAISDGTFNFSVTQKSENKFTGNCYAPVKVGLWRAGYVEGVDGGVSPSTEARGWLLAQGFRDVTRELPDARWAEPGDVIVYEYDETTIKKNNEKIKDALELFDKEEKEHLERKRQYEKEYAEWRSRQPSGLSALKNGKGKNNDMEPKPPKAPQRPLGENYGDIDVRTYDGYISDAKTSNLPSPFPSGRLSKGMVVRGIYRKFSDPLAGYRVLAFLKCLREWECHEEANDEKRYYYMFSAINDSRKFSDVSKHPFEGVDSLPTPAGAYQIRLATYQEHVHPKGDIACGFSPGIQGRIAVKLLQVRKALGAVRGGKISEAVTMLVNEWASLPGSVKGARREKRGGLVYLYDMNDFCGKYEKFIAEFTDRSSQ
jgi:muramidase (phage lysozyme)